MKSSAAQLRERQRRVFRWSLAVAAMLHVAVFVFWRGFEVPVLPFWSDRTAEAILNEGAPIYVQVLFGPPDIYGSDGTLLRQPELRDLEADRVLRVGDGALPQVVMHLRECVAVGMMVGERGVRLGENLSQPNKREARWTR